MTTKQTEQKERDIVFSTVIETAWVCAHYAHGQTLLAWLSHTLAQIQQTGAGQLPVIILPAAGPPDSLVVMTLRDFLMWSQRGAARNSALGKRDNLPTEEKRMKQDVDALTRREWEVLDLVGQGLSNQQIADTLVIEVATVEQHLSRIFEKLAVTSRLQAALKANVLVYRGQAVAHR